jgi:hypothetical protein
MEKNNLKCLIKIDLKKEMQKYELNFKFYKIIRF